MRVPIRSPPRSSPCQGRHRAGARAEPTRATGRQNRRPPRAPRHGGQAISKLEILALAPELPGELLLAREVELVAGGEDLLRALAQGVAHGGVVLVGAEDQADGRVLVRALLLGLVVARVEQHLAHVLLRKPPDLEVDEQEAPQRAVVEHEVDVEMVAVDRDAFLARHEEQVAAQLQEELLQPREQRGLQVALAPRGGFGQARELQHVGVLDEVLGPMDGVPAPRQVAHPLWGRASARASRRGVTRSGVRARGRTTATRHTPPRRIRGPRAAPPASARGSATELSSGLNPGSRLRPLSGAGAAPDGSDSLLGV